MSDALARLAALHGIALAYDDADGRHRTASTAALRAILASMRIAAVDDDDVHSSLRATDEIAGRPIDPLIVVRSDRRPWNVRVALVDRALSRPLRWGIVVEATADEVDANATRTDVVHRYGHRAVVDVGLDAALPDGYHALTLFAGDEVVARGTLAVAPPRCYRPAAIREGGRAWGVVVQLYGVRSNRNWGIGDFTDLAALAGQCGAEGADIVGVNPLHALFPHNPSHASPYSPSSRLFLNPMYVDVEAIPEFAACERARDHVASPGFQATLDALRAAPLVDYPGVARAKLHVMSMLHVHARRTNDDAARARASHFAEFKVSRGDALQRQALFEALQAHCFEANPGAWGWPAWPPEYCDPDGPAVRAFAATHAEQIDFYAWVHWQAESQRAGVAARASASGMAVGLYADLAVSVDRGGADAWNRQALYAHGASVGAPPDPFNQEGQDWGLPPMIPRRLVDAAYAPFIDMLRANMRDAGALRIDHVMGLLRLYWVPFGASAKDGAYVRYPLDALAGLLALESHRHRCAVIGEDLGTVPDEVRRALSDNDVLSYRVLLFEREAADAFKPPSRYPEAAMAVASTHDLPTLRGWWEGHDIALRARCGQLGAHADLDAHMALRVADRGRLLGALDRAHLLPGDVSVAPQDVPTLTPALATAVHVYLARTPSALVVVQPEDALGVRDQANLPGTVDSQPNWRRKLPVLLDAWWMPDGPLHAVAHAIGRERGRGPA
ncbi:MAG: 4-alpha-glucanotransferase [Betaproteobacteria bacterium]